jgi:alkyldihydroxyacetonephosphate synthase
VTAARRWNGWGDPTTDTTLPPTALALLARSVGSATPPADASLAAAVASVAPSRLEGTTVSCAWTTDSEARLRHARGQSLPDWIALRSGRVAAVPDAVALPASGDEVRGLLERAGREGWTLVPYGGGTSVVGGVTVEPSDRPVVTVDLARLAGLLGDPDLRSGLATFGAGTRGPGVEAELGRFGLTLGHLPQSFEFSTVGGWVATRSAGQESLGAGRIERLFAGGRVETPAGSLILPPFPASAAGPDLRELVLGSEGRIGIITEVTVRAVPPPARSIVRGYSLPDQERALGLGRSLAQSGLPLRFVRISTKAETATTIAQVRDDRRRAMLGRYLRWRRHGTDACFVLVGVAGPEPLVRATEGEVARLVKGHGGIGVPGLGAAWRRERFRAAYLRNALWEAGYATDTVETAAPWSVVPDLVEALDGALRDGLSADGERVLAFSHLSHLYPSGSGIYTTYLYRLADDADVTLDRWQRLKKAASDTIVRHGATISHQHGVGRDHAPYLAHEKGALGMDVLTAVLGRFDPDGIMARGVLLADGGRP